MYLSLYNYPPSLARLQFEVEGQPFESGVNILLQITELEEKILSMEKPTLKTILEMIEHYHKQVSILLFLVQVTTAQCQI